MGKGCDIPTATALGKAAAKEVIKQMQSYAGALGSNRQAHSSNTGTTQQAPVGRQNMRSSPTTTTKQSTYKRGTAVATATTSNIAYTPTRPDHYNNKCLVVSRVNRGITEQRFKDYVDTIAKKKINILYLKDITKKGFKHWYTYVLELSPDDYTLLSNENLWYSSLGIKEFSGKKYWRYDNKTSNANATPNLQPTTAVGDSWIAA